MQTKVKICGIRSVESAKASVMAGADYLGFIFVPKSKHFIKPESAQKIIQKIKNKIKITGIFQNANLSDVNNIAHSLQLDYVQLHGEETPEYCQQIKAKLIKAFRLNADFEVPETISIMQKYKVDYYLIDRENQGQGEMLNLKKAHELTQKFPLFFAGGLNVANVHKVVQYVQPFGVDVTGGVQTNGLEDLEKIREFIKAVKNYHVIAIRQLAERRSR